MRRIIWLCEKYLTDKQWYNLLMEEEMETLFDDLTSYFITCLPSLTVEELCDILWVYGTLGYRPIKLIQPIVSKFDRILKRHKKHNFGYKSNNENDRENEEINTEKEYNNLGDTFEDQDARVYGYVRGQLKLPFKSYQLSDIVYSYGNLRIESGNIVTLLEAMILDHFEHNNRLLDQFLPRDLRFSEYIIHILYIRTYIYNNILFLNIYILIRIYIVNYVLDMQCLILPFIFTKSVGD